MANNDGYADDVNDDDDNDDGDDDGICARYLNWLGSAIITNRA